MFVSCRGRVLVCWCSNTCDIIDVLRETGGRGGPLLQSVISHLIESFVFVPIIVGFVATCVSVFLTACYTHLHTGTIVSPVRPCCMHPCVPCCQLGVLFFLFEFFGDRVLALLVLLCLWAAELFLVLG